MKLIKLSINGYKNLKEKTIFDFTNTTNYVALIGLNGSGKSNVLEALSFILYCVYYKIEIIDILYSFEYEIEGINVKLENNEILINGKIRKKDYKKFLPTEIISSYSGEDLRMWEQIYLRPYQEYFNKIKSNVTKFPLRFVYINKYSWEIALLTLLCHDESKEFILDLLKIDNLDCVEINLVYSNKYQERKRLFENSTGANELTNLIGRIKENQNPIALSQISSIDINEIDNTKKCRKLFYYLFTATMPRSKKLISNIEINFEGKDVKRLSEGEKKLILIKCINTILAKKNSLILLDEPDASLHIHRKKQLKDIIDNEDRSTIITTHSPKLLKEFKNDNVFILNDSNSGVEVIACKELEALEHISNGEFTLMDATLAFATSKDILLVEGTNDYKYIGEALKRLKKLSSPKYDILDFTIINCGGAGNVAAVLEQVILPHINDRQLCISTFDYDQAGKNGIKGVNKIIIETGKLNIRFMTHPKLSDWGDNDFLTEDYFPITAYKPLFEAKVGAALNFRSLLSIQNPKGIIENKYLSFSDDDYLPFSIMLDEFLKLKNEF